MKSQPKAPKLVPENGYQTLLLISIPSAPRLLEISDFTFQTVQMFSIGAATTANVSAAVGLTIITSPARITALRGPTATATVMRSKKITYYISLSGKI